MTSRDLQAMATAESGLLLSRQKRQAKAKLAKAEKAARAAEGAPRLTRDRVCKELLDALAIAEEWGVLG